ncbi:hypothetical protein FF38_01468 [Lucilia cuprina]|uniref:PH domain-containing protein n=1 Tax=Lucilia cuprina TaxID=7375 RepID=A0A0L0BMZ3_LUCCU|nr:hypothetical protein FF38_01468 [Lucilia cuprina]
MPGLHANQNSAKVGQEFELIVGKDLNLEITMHVSMNTVQKPPRFNYTAKSPAKAESIKSENDNDSKDKPVNKVKGFFSRSPKKKQHSKFNSQASIKTQESANNKEYNKEKAKYDEEVKQFYKRADIWKNITGSDGEYCRGYLVASHYEQDIFGVAKTFNLSLYNEWDKTTKGVPRSVCDLNITMMYIPKLYASETIPESLQACQRTLERARLTRGSICQGYLTQQGGDCLNTWKRRWFSLNGSEMCGFTDSNGKKRAVIHLENVTDIKDHLTDDLWCIYKDRCFQIGFTDGEVIGFYADTVPERDAWVQALQHNVSNASKEKMSWTDLVVEREERYSS